MVWLRRGIVLWALAVSVMPAVAETRIALIIGNGAYTALPKLPNPPKDAEAMRIALQALGFSVDLGTNLDRDAMDRALIAFARKARTADVALVFYGGHGIQYRGTNYLAPIDADVTDEADLRRFVTAQQILEDLQGASRIRILVLDACRDNAVIQKLASTLPASRSAGLSRGLSRMSAPEGTLLAYSTQPDAVAADGAGGNSPFTTSLVKHLSDPGLDVRLVFARARADVYEASHHSQLPELSDSLVGEFSFTPLSAPTVHSRSPIENVARLEVSSDPLVKTCDRLASSPLDATRPGEFTGVKVEKIDVAQAVPACRAAHDAHPGEARITFELARSLNGQDAAAASTLFRSAADNGHVLSMYNLGVMHENGTGVPKDLGETLRWHRKAADGGYAGAMRALGILYETGKGVAKDPEEAVRWYRKGADGGDAIAMRALGYMYDNGKGVAKDPEEAVRWYRKAVEAGDAVAMRNLGITYENGTGVAKDFGEAMRWYRKGSDAGDAIAMRRAGLLYETGRGVAKDPEEAVRWYRKSADGGDAVAMRALGVLYETGKGVAKDLEEAVRWYRKGADGGDPVAMRALGFLYETGMGAPKDVGEAFRWYRKGADGNDAIAMRNLGIMYEIGKGVAKDPEEAVRRYRKAADGGDAVAMRALGVMYEIGKGVAKDPDEAFRWYHKGADGGDAVAMRGLGFMYEAGKSVAKDPEEAMRWYRKGADGGDAVSMANLGLMNETGKGVAKDLEEAIRWYRKAIDNGNQLSKRSLERALLAQKYSKRSRRS